MAWGDKNMQPDAAGCCASCASTAGCNIWVFCGHEGGCAGRALVRALLGAAGAARTKGWRKGAAAVGGARARPRALRPAQGECWLKRNNLSHVIDNFGQGHSAIDWTAGAVYSRAQYAEVLTQRAAAQRVRPRAPARLPVCPTACLPACLPTFPPACLRTRG